MQRSSSLVRAIHGRRGGHALRIALVAGVVALAALLAPAAASASSPTVWLCKPGARPDPCKPSLTTTVLSPTGKKLRVEHTRAARHPKVDCFYVYPTISNQTTPEATLRIDPEERSIALYQAARYSRDCRVFAPMYRQITLAGLLSPGNVTPAMRATAYGDVRDAWRTYLRKYNHGRGVVLISHSQGTFVLRQLVAQEIDKKPSVRRRLVSAILLGGNVTVKKGKSSGGDFKHIKACRSARQLGCVIAFSTFEGAVPAGSLFGRAGAGLDVLCTNPASLGGGAGKLDPVYPTAPFARGPIGSLIPAVGAHLPSASTAWVKIPNSYRGRCSAAAGAHVLQISPLGGAPTLHAVPDATWGLHLVDGNIGLGNLTDIVRSEAARFVRAHRRSHR